LDEIWAERHLLGDSVRGDDAKPRGLGLYHADGETFVKRRRTVDIHTLHEIWDIRPHPQELYFVGNTQTSCFLEDVVVESTLIANEDKQGVIANGEDGSKDVEEKIVIFRWRKAGDVANDKMVVPSQLVAYMATLFFVKLVKLRINGIVDHTQWARRLFPKHPLSGFFATGHEVITIGADEMFHHEAQGKLPIFVAGGTVGMGDDERMILLFCCFVDEVAEFSDVAMDNRVVGIVCKKLFHRFVVSTCFENRWNAIDFTPERLNFVVVCSTFGTMD
jgi:hypothetical protein